MTDIAALKAAAENAAPGPWSLKRRTSWVGSYVYISDARGLRIADEMFDNDANLIVLARNNLPALLSERDALIARVERYEAALKWYADPSIYKPHPHGPAFDRPDLSWQARAALGDQT